jgi:uncharacterized phage protein (TIGR01671 family)
MRTIKFRAWSKPEQKMYACFGFMNGQALIIKDDGHVGAKDEDFELMQFTGLTDKAGKETYEGDIVLITHPQDLTGDFTNAIGEVFWWDEEGAWYHGNNHGRPPKRMWKYVEIIGNVYEHPELLEEGHNQL